MSAFDSGAFDAGAFDASGGNRGTLTLTLEGVTVAASATAGHSGSLAVTLDDVAVAASATAGHSGSIAVTLDSVDVAAAGAVGHSGTLAVTLDDIGFDASSGAATVGGGGYDDDKPKRKKRYVVEVDGKLVAFSSRQMALQALNAGDEAQPAQQPKKAAQPLFSVSLDDVRKLAAEREALAQFQAQVDRMRYDALLKMYEDWQDEQDIEDLLMAL
jgi:hypothetical protein